MRFPPAFPALAGLLLAAVNAWGYDHAISTWQAASDLNGTKSAEQLAWFYEENFSGYDWSVYLLNGVASSGLVSEVSQVPGSRPDFVPKAADFNGGDAFWHVNDGWLVAFTPDGKRGGLFWFSEDGKKNYQISPHEVRQFLDWNGRLVAIEGVERPSISQGAVIELLRDQDSRQWQAKVLKNLPNAPRAAVVTPNHLMMIVLADSLVTLTPGLWLDFPVYDTNWTYLDPNSVVVSSDLKRAYIGMRRFVAEVNLEKGEYHYLVPDKSFVPTSKAITSN
ncbi:MAG TPA: hypothetical protein VIT91_08905 [Chthoniobacterales bacterium]